MSFLQLRSRYINKSGISSGVAATTYTVTVTALARIKNVATKTVTAKARVKQLALTKTVTAKGRVKAAGTTVSVTAKARIKNTTTRTVTAKARVKQLAVTKTVTAKARVKTAGTTVTVTAKSRIKQAAVTKTITAKARVKNTATATVTAKARVKGPGVTKTVTALARVKQLAITKTITAKANIASAVTTVTATVTAKARVRSTGVTKTVTSKGRVKQTVGYRLRINESMATAPAIGSIQGDAAWNAGGYILLTPAVNDKHGQWEFNEALPNYFDLSFDMYAGGGNGADAIWFYMGNSASPQHEYDDAGAYHVLFTEYSDIAAVRFYGSSLQSVAFNNLDNATWRTVRIIKRGNRFIVTVDGVATLDVTDSTRTLGGNLFGLAARTGGLNNQHRIKNVTLRYLNTSVDAKARIKQVLTKTTTAKARVKSAGTTMTVTAKARVKVLAVTRTLTAKARVKLLALTKTITSKARIKAAGQTVTVSAKARVKLPVTQTVYAKARVLYNRAVSVTARARVRGIGTTVTISAKARIKRLATTRTISAKASIFNIGRLKFYKLFNLEHQSRKTTAQSNFTKRRKYTPETGNYTNRPVQYK